MRYAISTTVNMFSMNQMTAAAVVEQRGAEVIKTNRDNAEIYHSTDLINLTAKTRNM